MLVKRGWRVLVRVGRRSVSNLWPLTSDLQPQEVEMNGKSFKLRDESTGFHDPETGLKIVRDQKIKVGSAPGKMTMQAIQVGRLVEVETVPGIAEEGEVHTRETIGEISKRGGGEKTERSRATRDRTKRGGAEERA